mmetsp:Transcript_44909/g.103682  ORF Transcript_44909/g.103682 Transcript_44909/m.103682 type:complete len:332 (+) Transcript_44909:80-1075(+)
MDDGSDENTPLTGGAAASPRPRGSLLSVFLAGTFVLSILCVTKYLNCPASMLVEARGDPTVHGLITPIREVTAHRTTPLRLPREAGPILVTGGCGFVGFHLSQRLASEGHKVVALDDFNPYYSAQLKRDRALQLQNKYGSLITVVDVDLCDGAKLKSLFAEYKFTHVVNLAAQAGVRYSLQQPRAYVRANVQCFMEVLEVIRHNPGTRLVYASSSSVYGTNKLSPFSESTRVDTPNSLYAATKKSNEAFALVYHQLYNISCAGLRFFTVYGPWGRPDMAYFSFAHRMMKGLPIQVYGHGRPRRDFTYIDDIVTGNYFCITTATTIIALHLL